MIEQFTKTITIQAGYHKINVNPSKNYGVHGCNLLFILKGSKGAVQFLVYTGWMLPETIAYWNNKGLAHDETRYKPMAADLGYHSLTPQFEGQTSITSKCEYLDGQPCYYDGSTLNAEPVFEVMLREGSEGVWRELEQYYNKVFGTVVPEESKEVKT